MPSWTEASERCRECEKKAKAITRQAAVIDRLSRLVSDEDKAVLDELEAWKARALKAEELANKLERKLSKIVSATKETE